MQHSLALFSILAYQEESIRSLPTGIPPCLCTRLHMSVCDGPLADVESQMIRMPASSLLAC